MYKTETPAPTGEFDASTSAKVYNTDGQADDSGAEETAEQIATPSILEIARAYCAAGLSVIPVKVDGSKAPAIKWKQYQSRIADDRELEDWFADSSKHGIGIAGA